MNIRALDHLTNVCQKLLSGLVYDFGNDQLAVIQQIIGAEKSDLSMVPAYLINVREPLTWKDQADRTLAIIRQNFNQRKRRSSS